MSNIIQKEPRIPSNYFCPTCQRSPITTSWFNVHLKQHHAQQQFFLGLTTWLEQQGTTGAATAAEVFGFPSPEPSSSGAKRKRFTAPVAPKSQSLVEESTASTSSAIGQNVPGEEEEPELTFQMGDKDDSPDITVKLHEELKHGSEQCFCGKSDIKTQEDKDKHYKMAHFQKGRGINPKTGKKNHLWACSTCNKVCKNNRGCMEALQDTTSELVHPLLSHSRL